MNKNNRPEEIVIPEPINKRPMAEELPVAEHPVASSAPTQKFGIPYKKNNQEQSRFEPPASPVEVPSHGWLYRGKFNDPDACRGIIKVRQMTLYEEKILTTDRFVQNGKALDMILERCIKSDIDINSLLSSDRLYLLFYLRGMTYGLDYRFNVKCYHCSHNFEQKIEVDKLPIYEWTTEEEAREPVEMVLPITKFKVKAHFMRGYEEQQLAEAELNSAQSINEPDSHSSELLNLLIDEIKSPDGEILSPRDRKDFIDYLVASDADYIRDQLNDKSCGIKQLDNIKCPKCGGLLEFNVPLGRNFFRRSGQ